MSRPTQRASRWPWIAALGAVALGAWLLLPGKHSDVRVAGLPEQSPPAPVTAGSNLATTIATRRPAALSPGPRMRLPPADVPLKQVLPELIQAARGGDVGAMCRLSYEFHRCATLPRLLRRGQESLTDRLLATERDPSETTESLEKSLAEDMAEQEKIASICAGVGPTAGLEPWRLLRDAARAGHVPSMVKFAVYFPIDNRHFLADMDGLEAFRSEAMGFLKRAEALGDPSAAYHLFWAYNGNGNMLESAGLVQADPLRALAYDLALRDIADARTQSTLKTQEAKLRRKLSAAEQGEAERLGAQLALRYVDKRGANLDIEQNRFLQSPDACN